jgi:Uma2 family endonuclease
MSTTEGEAMTAEILPWAGHQLTLADWEAMPEDEQFPLELVEGLLSIMPNPYSWHQHAAVKLTHRVTEQLSRDLIALSEVEVVITAVPLTIRSPDVIVISTDVFERNPPRVAAADVLLSGEFTGPVTLDVAGRPVTVDPSVLTRR